MMPFYNNETASIKMQNPSAHLCLYTDLTDLDIDCVTPTPPSAKNVRPSAAFLFT